MRAKYQILPGSHGEVPRPFVDVYLIGIPEVPISCLVDSGAIGNRFSAEFAHLAGIDLEGVEPTHLFLGGRRYVGRDVVVTLTLGEHSWGAPVSFVDEWAVDYQILGQEGFFRWFDVCFHAGELYFDVEWADR